MSITKFSFDMLSWNMFDLQILKDVKHERCNFYSIFSLQTGKNKKLAQNGTHGIPLLLNLIMLRIIEQRIKVQKFAEPAEKGHQNKLTTS